MTVINLVAENTIEQRMLATLAHKQAGAHSVLYVVVDGDPAQWRPRLTELHEEYFRDTDPLAPVRLEIIDRATDEALQRLVEAGLVARTTRATRPLFPQDQTVATPSALTEAEREQAATHRGHGARKLHIGT